MPRAFLIKKHSPGREPSSISNKQQRTSLPSPYKVENIETRTPPPSPDEIKTLDLSVPDRTDGRGGPFDLTVKHRRADSSLEVSSTEKDRVKSSVIEFCPKIITQSTITTPSIGIALIDRRTPSPNHLFKPVTSLEPVNSNTSSARTPPWHRPFVPPPYPRVNFPLYPMPRHASDFYSQPTYIGSSLVSPPLVTLSPPRSSIGISMDQLSPCIPHENVSPTSSSFYAPHSMTERLHLDHQHIGTYRSQWIHKEGSTSPISRSDSSSDSGHESVNQNKIGTLISSNANLSSGQAPRYQCVDCNKSYSTYSGLSRHRQFHCVTQSKKSFNCKYCDKMYVSLGALKMHIRTHTLPCKCRVCGKAFSRPWLLQGHVRTHTGEKPFACNHCSRAFADRSNLRAHLQTHSDIKRYSCKACSKTFSRMSLLLKHTDGGCLASQQR